MKIPKTASVPCNGCTLCCRNDLIFLHPECGDVAATYKTVPVVHPFTGKPGLALAKKPTGECIYLGESGCTIHGRAPAICREFDCGKLFAKFDRPTRRRMVRDGLAGQDVFDQGRRVQAERAKEEAT